MANESDTNAPQAGAAASEVNQANAPQFGIIGQYIRDLSFENPGAPASIMASGANPASNVNINVQVKKQADDVYAVELTMTVKTEREGNVLFAVDLVYGGLFRVKNVPENQLPPLMMVEAPRLIFPFARQILANVTQAGGFPPLMMEPVDFAALYRRNLAAMAAKQKEAGAAAPAGDGAATPTVN
jgi:preprotein translocase subunit SecB